MQWATVSSIFSIAVFLLWARSDVVANTREVRFNEDIRPIISSKCFSCHGPDEASREADLRLDTHEGVFSNRGDYFVIVAGKPESSELYQRITSDDPSMRMPPSDYEKHLTRGEINLLKQWIEQGAKWDPHWSFVTPTRSPLPEVQLNSWAINPIDKFVLSRLELENLEPSVRADPRTLIRRVSFDLTGLPPRHEELVEFLNDKSANAYEKVVERLLASPHFGEHMARYWLDAARYGDTHGLHVDNYREMWPFRDWVINSFNINMPFDQFLVEQLAGDLLPNASLEQQIASGFNRCHVTTNEGGSIAEEVYVRNVVDRVSTMGTAIMGLTLGCAVCHDHKFDPITQQDFYQLFAFFNSLDSAEMDGNTKHPAPYVRVSTPRQEKKLKLLGEQIASLQHKMEQRVKASADAPDVWAGQLRNEAALRGTLVPSELAEGLVEYYPIHMGNGLQVQNMLRADSKGSLHGAVRWIDGMSGTALELSGDGYANLGANGELSKKRAFGIGVWVKAPDLATGTVIAKVDSKDLEKGYKLSLDDGYIVVQLVGRWPGYAIKVTTQDKVIQPGRWHYIFIKYDGRKLAEGLDVYVNAVRKKVNINCDSLHEEGSINSKNPLQIGRCDQEPTFAGLTIDEFRMYDRRLRDDEIRTLFLAPQAERIVAATPANWTRDQMKLLQEFATICNDVVYQDLAKQRDKLQQQYKELLVQAATSPVFRERLKPRSAFLLLRGKYDQRSKLVSRHTPQMLPPMSDDLPRNRLGLAKWLVGEQHPLTSRVAVNRIWQQLFGTGLVETSEDFGAQGSRPSHPELLDWLACEFRDIDWDVKGLIKTMVMSATYQQASSLDHELAVRDPKNRLHARGPRFRLDAEMVRDQALAISGLLVKQLGGRSVKPPQPDGLWSAVGLSSSDTVRFEQDHGPEKVHRRSLYTFWKRTSPPPQMSTFDAPSREACILRRERTNTPLQALMLMNDPQYMEAARHFAERIMHVDASLPEQRISWAFEQATMRLPAEHEVEELLAAYNLFCLNSKQKSRLRKPWLTWGRFQLTRNFPSQS